MYNPSKSQVNGSNAFKGQQSSPRPSNRSFTFPNRNSKIIDTIDEDAELSHDQHHLKSRSLTDGNEPITPQISQNPFEKSFQSIKLSQSTSLDSDSTLVNENINFPRPPIFHSKSGSHASINSVDTFTSLRSRRFNSSSSISSVSDLSLSNSSLPTLGSFGSFKKSTKYTLQNSVKLISKEQVFEMLDQDNLLIVDVRPYIEFNRFHLKNSINFNLPSTLLKRSNFTLQKCLSNLSLSENFKLRNFLYEDLDISTKKIIFYDESAVINNEVSLGIYGSLNKFVQHDDYNGELYVLENSFQSFKDQYPDTLESVNNNETESEDYINNTTTNSHNKGHSISSSNNSNSPIGSTFTPNRSISLAELKTTISPQSAHFDSFSAPLSLSSISSNSPNSPNLSRFQLPKIPKTPIFKIRHNEESYDFQNYQVLDEFKYLNTNSEKVKLLPKWLKSLLPTDQVDHKSVHSSLIEKFKILEMEEKNRINEMITNNSLGYGIELGSKNRYKDIFPYEHSRVKLIPTPTSEVETENDNDNAISKNNKTNNNNNNMNNNNANNTRNNDFYESGSSTMNYINANFISYPRLSDFKYIATQAPLSSTLSDFNKLINDNNIEIVIALTNQYENGIEKCYPYWNEKSIYEIIEQENLENVNIRRLKVVKSKTYREIIQIQILNWLDYDIIVSSQQGDILKLIYFKRLIMERLNILNENVLVHCSAGCGRTGTFCTLDTIININDEKMNYKLTTEPQTNNNEKINNNDNNNNGGEYNNNNKTDSNNNPYNKEFDPVFNIVENFRNQRISMVQSLRQYLFIYDCLCNYFENFDNFEKFDEDFRDLNILNNFFDNKLNKV